jgi:hypothetical protein
MNSISKNVLGAEDSRNEVAVGQQSSFQLTDKTLFRLALSVSSFDPSRVMLGFFYESKLRRECAMTLNGPICFSDFIGIWKAIRRRRLNPEYFQCTAIDIVLMNLLKSTPTNHDYTKG